MTSPPDKTKFHTSHSHKSERSQSSRTLSQQISVEIPLVLGLTQLSSAQGGVYANLNPSCLSRVSPLLSLTLSLLYISWPLLPSSPEGCFCGPQPFPPLSPVGRKSVVTGPHWTVYVSPFQQLIGANGTHRICLILPSMGWVWVLLPVRKWPRSKFCLIYLLW